METTQRLDVRAIGATIVLYSRRFTPKPAVTEPEHGFTFRRNHRSDRPECAIVFINRHLVKDILVWLHTAAPQPVDLDAWADLISSIVGSGADHERRFLELLRDEGLLLPSRQHYGLPDNGAPIAEIDFQVGNVHVLVDGSVHYNKWVQEVDDIKRDGMRFEGFTIVAFDMQEPAQGIQKLRSLI